MTSRTLAPRVLYRDILDLTHHFRTRPILDDRGLATRYGFRGLMVPLLVTEDSVHMAAGTRAMFQTDPTQSFLPGSMKRPASETPIACASRMPLRKSEAPIILPILLTT